MPAYAADLFPEGSEATLLYLGWSIPENAPAEINVYLVCNDTRRDVLWAIPLEGGDEGRRSQQPLPIDDGDGGVRVRVKPANERRLMDKVFNGALLALARQVRRKGQADLVKLLEGHITQGTLSKLEHGRIQPQPEMVKRLAIALKVMPSFFFQSAHVREPMVSYHRKRAKLAVRDADAVHGMAEIFRLNLKTCLEAVDLESVR